MRRLAVLALVFATATGPSACDRVRAADAATVVDSVVPRAEALRRFQSGEPRVDTLSGAAPTRAALIGRFVVALEHADTVALRAMTLTRAEYAWLYYPTSPQGLPPYDLTPELYWFLVEGRGRQGLMHLLEQRAGAPLRVAGHSCDAGFSQEGENRLWGPCTLRRLQAPGDTLVERLFGPIIEREGRFKFVSLANKL